MRSAYYSRANSYSKSYNAMVAESNGRYPRTIAAKRLGLSAKAFDAGCRKIGYTTNEWHHVGKYANRIDYYDTTELEISVLFWVGAKTKANAKLCNAHIKALLREKLFSYQPLAKIKFAQTWCNEYHLTLPIESDHLLFKGIREIVRHRATNNERIIKFNSTSVAKKYRIFRLYTDGRIELYNGNNASLSDINWDDYIPMHDYANYVLFYHKYYLR